MQKEHHEYRGWVPTVGGRLSFKHFGESAFPCRTISATAGHGSSRSVFAFQRRVLKDSILPRSVFRRLFECETDFIFLAAAGVNQHLALAGHIYVFFRGINANGLKWRDIRSRIHDNSRNDSFFTRVRKSPSADGAAFLTEFLRDHHNYLLANSIHHSDFTVDRDGITTIHPADNLRSIEANRAATEPDDWDYMAQQSFLFLRDITHTHQHHPASDDSLTTATCVIRSGVVQMSDKDWAEKTARLLYRFIIEYKKNNSARFALAAKGVTSYLKTFMGIATKRYPQANLDISCEFDNMNDSIDTKIHTIELRDALRARFLDRHLNPILGFLGIVLAVAGLIASPNNQIHPILSGLTGFAISRFDELLILAALVPLITYTILNAPDVLPESFGKQHVYTIVRILQVLRWGTAITVTLLITLLLFSSAVYVWKLAWI